MAAPKGNQFWKIRSKHGTDKLFGSPKLLLEAAFEYFEWCDENPLMESHIKVISRGMNMGSDAELIPAPKLRAYTMSGLCLYLKCSQNYFINFRHKHKVKDQDFVMVIGQIQDIIYNQKFCGAAADLLNPNIIARDLGLRDSTDITTKGDKLPEAPAPIKLTNKLIKDISKALDKEY